MKGELYLKKWIYGLVILFIAGYGYYFFSLSGGNNPRDAAFKNAESVSYNAVGLNNPKDFYMYRGNEKWDVINMAILSLCSLLFVIFFWNYYSARKKSLN